MQVRGVVRSRTLVSPGPIRARSQMENIWLRTKRYNASGNVASGTGGVCYLYFPAHLSADQRSALEAVGIR